MADPDPMTCDPGSWVFDPDPGTLIPDPIYLVTTLRFFGADFLLLMGLQVFQPFSKLPLHLSSFLLQEKCEHNCGQK